MLKLNHSADAFIQNYLLIRKKKKKKKQEQVIKPEPKY